MNSSFSDFLTREQIDCIRNPIETALTLPAHAYTSEAFYSLEVEKIYKKHWVAAFFDFEVPNPGDLKPFDLCGIPLVTVRGHDNVIRVFHNICPYDGCLAVIDPAEGQKEIVTPYHGWTYDLEGRLVRIPFWDGTREGNLSSLENKEVDLVAVHSQVFMNAVFINLLDNPEPFDSYIAPILRSTEEYDLNSSEACLDEAENVLVSRSSFRTNWKTHYENACLNVLHENFVHELYSQSPEIPRVNQNREPSFTNIIDNKFMALGYDRRNFLQTYPELEVPHLGKDVAAQPEQETFGTLYPNFYFSASSQFIEVCLVLPHGPSEVEQKAIYHMHKDVARSKEMLEVRKMVAEVFSEAAREDGRICEAVQIARRSPVYQQKFYAPFWDTMHHRLNNMIVDDLQEP